MSFITPKIFEDIVSPVTSPQLNSIDQTTGRVQFSAALSERDHQKLAERLRQFPEAHLRAYELFGTPERNLDFLKHYRGLKHLWVHLHRLESMDGIRHVADSLESLDFAKTEKKFPLDFLAGCKQLKSLHLEGHTTDIGVLSKLKGLEELRLRSITLPDLEIVAALPRLWSLDIKLGGTKNLAALSRLNSLKYLELWMVKGLTDVSVISKITSLQQLYLESVKTITTIPALDKLQKLRRVTLKNMKGIKDFSPLLGAKSLADVIVTRAAHVVPEMFLPLQRHSSLKAIGFGLGSNKKNQAVAGMFPRLQHTITYPFVYQ